MVRHEHARRCGSEKLTEDKEHAMGNLFTAAEQ
jgi:hypothetical protein